MLTSKTEQYTELAPTTPDPDHITPPRQFWCMKTMIAFGPDEGEAYLETCQPGRACYTAVVPRDSG